MIKIVGCTLLLALAACGRAAETPPDPDASPNDVAIAIEVSRGIEANPAATDSVLRVHGLTRTGLDSLLYRIAEDSGMTARYTAGISR